MRRLAALGLIVLLVVVLGVAQLVLPGIAAQHLRSQLERSGQVLGVSVSAFPAIELLWHQADSVTIHLGTYRPRSGSLPTTLSQSTDVGTLSATAREVDYGLIRLHHAALYKSGNHMSASALVAESDLRSALPILSSVTPVASAGGKLTLQGTAFGISADATVSAQNGALVVTPDVPFGALATITLFANPHIAVQQIAASPASSGYFAVKGTALVR